MDSTKPTTAEPRVPNHANHQSGIQFSVRDLLVLTTLVSVCLAIGVHYAGFMFVVIAIGLIQVGMLLSADWLIRPNHRKALGFVTAASWIILGSGLLILGFRMLYGDADSADQAAYSASRILGVSFAAAGAVCYITAMIRWHRLSNRPAKQSPNCYDEQHN